MTKRSHGVEKHILGDVLVDFSALLPLAASAMRHRSACWRCQSILVASLKRGFGVGVDEDRKGTLIAALQNFAASIEDRHSCDRR